MWILSWLSHCWFCLLCELVGPPALAKQAGKITFLVNSISTWTVECSRSRWLGRMSRKINSAQSANNMRTCDFFCHFLAGVGWTLPKRLSVVRPHFPSFLNGAFRSKPGGRFSWRFCSAPSEIRGYDAMKSRGSHLCCSSVLRSLGNQSSYFHISASSVVICFLLSNVLVISRRMWKKWG